MRDRLIELLEKADETVCGFDIYGDFGRLADELLANNVVVVNPIENDYCGYTCNYMADIVNRQKAEKEALIAGQETLQKYIAEQKAEIERLVEEGVDLVKQLPEMLKLAQAEAIKEFAERLKSIVAIHNGDMWSKYEYIDNLVKEMVGEDK